MPKVFLSPSTQEWNEYISGGSEEQYMNLLADRLEPYLRSSGITYVRNDRDRNVVGAIKDSNSAYYDAHLALHSNAAPDRLSGQLRGIDVYFAPGSYNSERLANIIANNIKQIYPIPDKVRAVPTTSLGELTQTRAVAVLAELGYHDNIDDEAWIKGSLDAIAKNLAQSLCDYFGIPFINAGPIFRGMVSADGSNLNLRSYPSTGGQIIGRIPDGASVSVYGNAGNGWYVVNYNGQVGYASGEYIIIG